MKFSGSRIPSHAIPNKPIAPPTSRAQDECVKGVTNNMPFRNITSLDAWRHKDSREVLEYLIARLDRGDLRGLMIQSLGKDGKERVHATGAYKDDPSRALGAALSMSVRMTASSGGFEDSSF